MKTKMQSEQAIQTPNTKVHAFNTGRGYTSNGQRIAWTLLSTGNVAMLDIDRGIDYILVFSSDDAPTRNSEVLHAYDNNRSTKVWNEAEYKEARELQSALHAAAMGVRS